MRKIQLLLAALLASLAATALVVAIGSGSSHREAPLTSMDPTADDTDVYAFTAAEAPGALTVVANWVPFEDPAGGPNFYRFDDRARYYINIDNTGDGDYDVRYRFDFRTKLNDKNFLHSLTQVTGLNDPQLLQKESYEIVRETFNSRGRRTTAKSLGSQLPRRSEQRRTEDDAQLRGARELGDPLASRWRQGVRRPARRRVLRAAGSRLRLGQPRGCRHGQHGRRHRHARGLRHAVDRAAGPGGAA